MQIISLFLSLLMIVVSVVFVTSPLWVLGIALIRFFQSKRKAGKFSWRILVTGLVLSFVLAIAIPVVGLLLSSVLFGLSGNYGMEILQNPAEIQTY